MIRATSSEAYRIIRESGLLSASRMAVYSHLYRCGPLTRNEIDRNLAEGRPNPTYSRRLAEMERMCVLARVGERVCSVTGFRAETWDVTDRLPQPLAKRRGPTRAMVQCLVAELRGEIPDPAAFVDRWRDAVAGAVR